MNPLFRPILQWLPSRMQRSLGSLSTQLIFGNVIALLLLLGVLGIICRYVTYTFMIHSVDQELDRGIEMFLRPPPEPPPFQKGGFSPPPPGHQLGFRSPHPPDGNNPYHPHLFNSEGLSDMPDDKRPVWDASALASALGGEIVHSTVTVDGEPVRIVSSPAFNHDGKRGAVQNGYPLKDVYRAVSGVNMALLLLIPAGLLGAAWVGSTLTNRILKRLHRMTQAAARIGAEDFSRRLPVSGSDEFSELAGTFNGLLGRLNSAYQEQTRMLELQRRFTADASHELKTPLTIIKVGAGLALSRESTDERSCRTFQEIDTAADTMSQLVQDLLLLARSDAGQMGRDPIEMLAREVLERAANQTRHEGSAPITLKIEPDELSVWGNEAELVRLFRNLLDNAARYTPAEGQITVTACSSKGDVLVTIEDTGTGIAPEHLPHLGERFYRIDTARARPDGGTGLGLSICKSIVEAHHGTMSIESALGKGTSVRVILPRPQ